ncbi:MAG: hypothetical protein CSA20_07535 [Deltaproteobacteria bacterium]|nr:MAG: hypothetical protein CSB23_00685 [Deltaproteobacteria bacterium]PIE72483.1 MAG: hypothetical protein CSA20_07535 [Deltaproteobacteria bacterium]
MVLRKITDALSAEPLRYVSHLQLFSRLVPAAESDPISFLITFVLFDRINRVNGDLLFTVFSCC